MQAELRLGEGLREGQAKRGRREASEASLCETRSAYYASTESQVAVQTHIFLSVLLWGLLAWD
jgi:hypothetical protein